MAAAAVMASGISEPLLQLATRDPFKCGHVFLRQGISHSLLRKIKALNGLPEVLAGLQKISGGYKQMDLERFFTQELEREVLMELRAQGVLIPDGWQVHVVKTLIGEPGVLEQIPHKDSMHSLLSVIVHLSEGNAVAGGSGGALKSTQISRFVHPPTNPQSAYWPAQRWPERDEDYVDYDVQEGSVTVFPVYQPHRAPRNHTSTTRVVLFLALGPAWRRVPTAEHKVDTDTDNPDLVASSEEDWQPGQRFRDTNTIYVFEYLRRSWGNNSADVIKSVALYYRSHNALNVYRDFPRLAALFRSKVDIPLYEWTTTRLLLWLPDLVSLVFASPRPTAKKSKGHRPVVATAAALPAVTDEDRAFARVCLEQGLLTEEQFQTFFASSVMCDVKL